MILAYVILTLLALIIIYYYKNNSIILYQRSEIDRPLVNKPATALYYFWMLGLHEYRKSKLKNIPKQLRKLAFKALKKRDSVAVASIDNNYIEIVSKLQLYKSLT